MADRLRGALRAPVTWAVLGFLATRLLAWAAGVRFDSSALAWGWHFLDLGELTAHYVRSLWHLHAQPPLLNAYVGAVLMAAPQASDLVFHATFLAMGLAFTVGGHALLVRLGVGPWLATLVVVAFAASPASILYEHWLFYTYPEAVLACLSALALHRFAEAGRRRDAAALFAALGTLALMRAVFHLGWLLLVAGALLAFYRHDRARMKAVALGSAVPILLVFGLYAKNAVLFGTFGASSWLGMSFHRMSVAQLDAGRQRALADQGRVSELAVLGGFRPVADYPPAWRDLPKTGVPVLDEPRRANGAVNYNHLAYVGVGRQLLADGKAVLRDEPALYLKALARSHVWYFRPSSHYFFLAKNMARISPYQQAYEAIAYGKLLRRDGAWPADAKLRRTMAGIGWWLPVALPLLLLYAFVLAWRTWRRGEDEALAVTLAYMAATVAFATAVGNGLEIGENNRFRFGVEFLFLAFLAVFVARRRWAPAWFRSRPS